ncbi:hypothetical protein [Rhodanobacter sp. 115]|uniref:hypothetical protein n=1 Tax=Rhodanobacter sp. FW021-MT20 TaxID=1162282 RepID=UPI000260DEED|nr:hypothetical protein [Rhodanobacter sp. 115]EIL97814.1 hypothetical protein UU5_04584 [Rhodanobacter sp. 115]
MGEIGGVDVDLQRTGGVRRVLRCRHVGVAGKGNETEPGGNQGGKKWRGFQGTLLTTNPSQKIATADKGPMLARA